MRRFRQTTAILLASALLVCGHSGITYGSTVSAEFTSATASTPEATHKTRDSRNPTSKPPDKPTVSPTTAPEHPDKPTVSPTTAPEHPDKPAISPTTAPEHPHKPAVSPTPAPEHPDKPAVSPTPAPERPHKPAVSPTPSPEQSDLQEDIPTSTLTPAITPIPDNVTETPAWENNVSESRTPLYDPELFALALENIDTQGKNTPVYRSILTPGTSVYTTHLAKNIGQIDVVIYHNEDHSSWTIEKSWNEGILGADGQQAFCSQLHTNFKGGYKTVRNATSLYSQDVIDRICSALAWYDSYKAGLKFAFTEGQDYMFKQCIIWAFLNAIHNWYPGAVLEFGNGQTAPDGSGLAHHVSVVMGGAARAAADAAWRGKFSCSGYIFEGEGQDLSRWFYSPHLTISKTALDNGKPLTGAIFQLYSWSDYYTASLGVFTDNRDGTYTFAGLDPSTQGGNYLIRETTPPPGYTSQYQTHSESDKQDFLGWQGRQIKWTGGGWKSHVGTPDWHIFRDYPRSRSLTVNKVIHKNDIWWAHGEPTFLFRISGNDASGKTHTYHRMLTFTKKYVDEHTAPDGSIRLGTTIKKIPAGTYTVEELKAARFALTNVAAQTDNISITKKATGSIYEGIRPIRANVSADLTLKNGEVTFFNRKITWDQYSHKDAVINRIPIKVP